MSMTDTQKRGRTAGRRIIPAHLLMLLAWTGGCGSPAPKVRLFEWERGIGVESLERPGMAMYLWFYEWNMFDAVRPGEHTHGEYSGFERSVSPDGRRAEVTSDDMTLTVRAVRDGAELQLVVTNRSEHDWPEPAGIIPCFNPGPPGQRNPAFANRNTFFVGPEGLVRQLQREIHFNGELREHIDALAHDGAFAFSFKWPTSPINATAGLLLRESGDGEWVTGIAWERFVSAQGHNPWECMHLCVRLGPLKRGESRTVRGMIYLFKGDRNDCLRRYQAGPYSTPAKGRIR